MARKQRAIPEINAGSMADIAFLLLIFFLVTTTMDQDSGVKALLPPMPPEDFEPPPIKKKNIFEIRINSNNQMLVEGEYIDIKQLKDKTVKFITNFGKDENLSDNPQKAIISLKNDRGTEYDIYVQVQDQLRLAYREVRDKVAQERFQRNFDELSEAQQKLIQTDYPQKISEAEPENIGGN
jgi:biopolymer transport protein ExbD